MRSKRPLMRPLLRCSATCTSLLECSRWAKSSVLKKLFELLYLAERYEVGNLKTKTEDALQSLTLTQENMIFTATVAKKFKKVFDKTSTKLLMRCLKFLFATTNGAGDICALIK